MFAFDKQPKVFTKPEKGVDLKEANLLAASTRSIELYDHFIKFIQEDFLTHTKNIFFAQC
jgi:hypothetical protein